MILHDGKTIMSKITVTEFFSFVDYVMTFYGHDGLYSSFFSPQLRRDEIIDAVTLLLNSDHDFAGDSFDREIIRDILLKKRGRVMTEYDVTRFLK